MGYLEETIKRAVWLRRVENGLAKEIELLFESEMKLTGTIQNHIIRLRASIERLYVGLDASIDPALVSIAELASGRTVAAMESLSGKKASAVSVSRPRLSEILDGDAIEGRTLSEWRTYNRLRFHQRLNAQMNESIIAGESSQLSQTRFIDKVLKPSIRAEQILEKTAASNLANAAVWESAEASGLSRGYRIKVTLDGRTSKICLSIAAQNRVYPYAPSSPRPPLHLLCRSILMPVVIGHEHKDIPQDGDAWFHGLSDDKQDDILGPKRAALFRRGRIGLADLVRSDNSIATIPELRGVSALFSVQE